MGRSAPIATRTSSEKGSTAEAKILAALVELGYQVLLPWNSASRYDLAIDLHGDLIRVQCKIARFSGRGEVIRFFSSSAGRKAGAWSKADYLGDCDLFAVYCFETDKVYAISVDECPLRDVTLRITPAKNNQQCRMAADYEIKGVLAQLGERYAGSVEVKGSSPLHST